jgi:uncharacterized iron-regulated membrane protein
MSLASCQAILGMGIFFIVLGLGFIVWDRREKRAYYDSLLDRKDLREFIERQPQRSWMNAWRTGGRISLMLGLLLGIAGAALWLILY